MGENGQFRYVKKMMLVYRNSLADNKYLFRLNRTIFLTLSEEYVFHILQM